MSFRSLSDEELDRRTAAINAAAVQQQAEAFRLEFPELAARLQQGKTPLALVPAAATPDRKEEQDPWELGSPGSQRCRMGKPRRRRG